MLKNRYHQFFKPSLNKRLLFLDKLILLGSFFILYIQLRFFCHIELVISLLQVIVIILSSLKMIVVGIENRKNRSLMQKTTAQRLLLTVNIFLKVLRDYYIIIFIRNNKFVVIPMISPQNRSNNNSPDILSVSPRNQNKGELKKVDQQLSVAKNRLATLRQQLQKQKQAIKKNKALTQQVISKKIAVNEINNYKQKDNSEDIARIQYLKKRNQSVRLEHQKSIENIQKAIYLVKLDDAREVKNISQEHKRRIRLMQNDEFSKKMEKKKQLKEDSDKAKQRYMKYWKEKLSSIYAEQALNAHQLEKSKEQKQKQLKMLAEQQIKLLQEINLYHSKNVQSKKQYVAALSLPVKEVAMAMSSGNEKDSGQSLKKSIDDSRSKSLAEIDRTSLNKSKNMYSLEQNPSLPSIPGAGGKMKVPHTMNVNETKLKIILQQLKRIERKKQRYQDGEGEAKEGGESKR